jgi:NAD(P)-dependent dehydrogenase (short-subunit alcohol dehydrogenase family)
MAEVERVAVITGAASGMGRAAARIFSERGFRVVAVDLVAEALAWAADNERIVIRAGDVSTEEANREMVAAAVDRWGRLDVAILNAGIGGAPNIEHPNALERYDAIQAVNTRGVLLGMRHAIPAMRAGGGGAIVVTASTSGIRADPSNWAYNVSKAGVDNLVKAVAIDYATQGIRVNAVAPGPIETGLTAGMKANEELYDDMRRRIPMQRWGQPEEVAEVMWFLASPAASFVTGVTVPVDGGITSNAGQLPYRRAIRES